MPLVAPVAPSGPVVSEATTRVPSAGWATENLPAVVSVSKRVLVHLARYSRATLEGTSAEMLTQRGIGSALGVTQGALSSVLRRLEDGGAVVSERAHVARRDRRVTVYVLTPRGEELARLIELEQRDRRSGLPSPSPGDRGAPRSAANSR